MGVLKITRTSQWANRARKIKVLIDGEAAGTIAHGQAVEFPLTAGAHELSAKIDWCRTKPLTVQVESDRTVELELGCTIAGGFGALYTLVFAPHEYLYLRAPSA